MKKQELLAPAGDIEAGYAALYYGADAVYLGLPKFSARATATNFDEKALDEFTAYAHSIKRKVYVALNTVLQESELDELIKSLDVCTKCHVDGLIIQDLGVARVMKENYPWFEMHASTQMAVHNKEGALFLKKMGFKRVVLARELTEAEIKDIASISDLETEAFIHGALCYSYSGLCQFSAIELGRSANRGKCLYPCRACFKYNGKAEHLFSMKDMALQEEILNMPVDSLKIEGRKKSALYVAAVTDYYRHILDGKGAEKLKEDRIKQIFSRPWCKFHFKGKSKDIIDRNFVGHRGLLVGEVENIRKGHLIFTTDYKISRYDGLQIDVKGSEKPFGFSVQKIYVKHKSCFEAKAGEIVEVELPAKYPTLQKGDKIYLASSSEVKGAYDYEKPKSNLYRNIQNIDVYVKVECNRIIAKSMGYKVEVGGRFAEANNPQKSEEAIKNAFAKTGDTSFKLNSLTIDNKDNLFTPSSLLNELRRELYSIIKIEDYKGELPEISRKEKSVNNPYFKIKVDDINYLNLLDFDKISEIIYLINPKSDIDILDKFDKQKIRIALPAVCRAPKRFDNIVKELLARGYNKWEVANYWSLEYLPIDKLDVSFDTSLYMLNSQALTMAEQIGAKSVNLSIEDTLINICNIIEKSPLSAGVVIYQDIPLFTSVGCIRDNDCRVCKQGEKWFDLEKDGHKFMALSRDCQIMLFDKNPYCIAQDVKNILPDYFRVDFVYKKYTPEKVKEIFDNIIEFKDVTDCIKGNLKSKNI